VDGFGQDSRPAFRKLEAGGGDLCAGSTELNVGGWWVRFVGTRNIVRGDQGGDAEVVPVIAGLIALVVVAQAEGIGGIFGAGDFGMAGGAAEAEIAGDLLDHLLMLIGCGLMKDAAEGKLVIAAKSPDDMGAGGAVFVERAGGFELLDGRERDGFRSELDDGRAGFGDDKGVLAANEDVEEAIGSNLSGASSQVCWPFTWTVVMRWLKAAGDGTVSLKRTPAPMRTACGCSPIAVSMAARRVCLSLQSPYWFSSTSEA
jgi:hypothetical protein